MLRKAGFAALMLSVAFIAGCGGGGGGGGGDNTSGGGPSTETLVPGMQIRTLDMSDNAISGAEVVFDGKVYKSNDDGIVHIQVDEGKEGIFTVIKSGFVKQQKSFYAGADSQITVFDVRMMARENTGTIPAATGGQVTHSSGSSVTVPENAFVRKDGTPATGTINVHITHVDPTNNAQLTAFPGNMEGIPVPSSEPDNAAPGLFSDGSNDSNTPIHSYGMADFSFTDAEGNELQLAEGKTASIDIALLQTSRPVDAEGESIEMTSQEAVEAAANAPVIDTSQFRPISEDEINASRQSALGAPLVGGETLPKWYYKFFETEEEEEGNTEDNAEVTDQNGEAVSEEAQEAVTQVPTGYWIQDGIGTIMDRGAGATGARFVMRSEVSHFTPWNCDGMPSRAFIRLNVQCRDKALDNKLAPPQGALIDWLAPGSLGWARNSPYHPNSRGDTLQGTTCYTIHSAKCPEFDEELELAEQCIVLNHDTPVYRDVYLDYYSVK